MRFADSVAGFERLTDGSFLELIDPAGFGTFTATLGLNDSAEIALDACGYVAI